MRKLAGDAQLATGYLPMCLSGKRILSTKALHKLMPHLKLNSQERRFLELLHLVGTTEEPHSRLQALKDMSRMQSYRAINSREVDVYQYLTKWYYVAIREMVALNDFQPHAAWIRERIGGRVTLAECEEALTFLIDKGFIVKNENGKFCLPHADLQCKEGVFKTSLGEFHRQMFQQAAHSIEQTLRPHRHILGVTFSIDHDKMEEVRAILNETQERIEKLAKHQTTRTQVYQVQLAAFPLTRIEERKESEDL